MKSHEGPESQLEKAACPIAEHCHYSVCIYCVHENQKYRVFVASVNSSRRQRRSKQFPRRRRLRLFGL